ncbi:MAG: hypothetical protein ABFD54_04145 [Armatimonadota bacterium]|nr:hypothetical protein [bacterium]
MRLFKNPELRGIVMLSLIILILGGVLAASTGKLEQWFNITLFSGPKVLDKIIFVSDRSGSNEIYLMDLDGSNQKQLTQHADVDSVPSISLSGNHIAYIGKFRGQEQVLSIGAAGGNPEQLTSATGPKKQPCYTPDGKRLSFIASGKLYVADLNGDNPSPVLPTEHEIHSAMSSTAESRDIPAYFSYAWSPDGQGVSGVTRDHENHEILAYIPKHDSESEGEHGAGQAPPRSDLPVDRVIGYSWAAAKRVMCASLMMGKKSALFIIDDENKRQGTLATVERQEFGRPCLSPDATMLVVPVKSKDKKNPNVLLKVDLQSGQGMPIAKGLFENPCYSPSGDQVMATMLHDGKRDIVVVDPADGQLKQLTKDGGSFDAIWSPVSEK